MSNPTHDAAKANPGSVSIQGKQRLYYILKTHENVDPPKTCLKPAQKRPQPVRVSLWTLDGSKESVTRQSRRDSDQDAFKVMLLPPKSFQPIRSNCLSSRIFTYEWCRWGAIGHKRAPLNCKLSFKKTWKLQRDLSRKRPWKVEGLVKVHLLRDPSQKGSVAANINRKLIRERI